MSAWGWRVAFAASGLAGLVSLWWARSARRPAPTASKTAAPTMAELLRGYWRPLLWVILLTAGGSAAFYTATVTVPYLIRETFYADGGAAAERASTGLVLAAFVILMLMQPLGGALSDRIGRKPLLVVFGLVGVAGAGVLVTAATRVTSPVLVFAVLVLAFAVLTCYLSVNGIAKAEVFPAHIRALGVGFGYAVSNSLFGGTAPLMFHATGGGVGFIVYLTVLLAVTAGAAIAMRGGVGTVLDAPKP